MATKKSNKDKPIFDLRQSKMLQMYLNPKDKKHFGNAYQSAVDAGYAKTYALSITYQAPWLEKALSEILGKPTDKKNLVEKSKKVLNRTLDMVEENPAIAQKSAQFIASTDPEFSRKEDITTGGEKITAPIALVEFVDGKEEDTDTKGI